MTREERPAYRRAYYLRTREKEIARSRAWCAAHPEETKAHRRAFHKRHKEIVNAASREYRASMTPEEKAALIPGNRERDRKWRRENPDANRARIHRRKARVNGNGGEFAAWEWAGLKRKYHYRCLCCGRRVPLTADHVVPVEAGGTSDIENIQPLCAPCNSSKGSRHATDYRLNPHPNCLS